MALLERDGASPCCRTTLGQPVLDELDFLGVNGLDAFRFVVSLVSRN